MKFFVMLLTLTGSAFAAPTTLVDETFKTTFSDYGKLNQFLTCTPGYKGGFATPDILTLQSAAIELGFDIENAPFRASSYEALNKETPHSGAAQKRPYNEGCKPALEKFLKAIDGKDIVEVEVHRQVSDSSNIHYRANRKRNGDVNSVKHIESEYRFETYEVDIAGFSFQVFRTINGKSRDL